MLTVSVFVAVLHVRVFAREGLAAQKVRESMAFSTFEQGQTAITVPCAKLFVPWMHVELLPMEDGDQHGFLPSAQHVASAERGCDPGYANPVRV